MGKTTIQIMLRKPLKKTSKSRSNEAIKRTDLPVLTAGEVNRSASRAAALFCALERSRFTKTRAPEASYDVDLRHCRGRGAFVIENSSEGAEFKKSVKRAGLSRISMRKRRF